MPQVRNTRTERNSIKTKVIQSQHCIQVNDDQIEIIYQFASCVMEVHLNDELIIRTTFHPSRIAINYLNLVEVACNYWIRKQDQLRRKEKQELKELNESIRTEPKKDFKKYLLDELTQCIIDNDEEHE